MTDATKILEIIEGMVNLLSEADAREVDACYAADADDAKALNQAADDLRAQADRALKTSVAALRIGVEGYTPQECENIGDNGSTCDDRNDEPCRGCLNARALASIRTALEGASK